MTDDDAYYRYLKGRSALGLAYRRYYLYPRLCRHLKGMTLDIGCGIGDFLRFRPDSVGVDVNPLLVDHCKRLGMPAQLAADGVLPFADRTFDSALMDNVVEHIVDPSSVLMAISRVLRLGGTLLVGVPGRRGYKSDADHRVFYGERELKVRLEGAGFRHRYTFCTPFRSRILDSWLKQYCVYAAFQNTGEHTGTIRH